MMVDKNHPCYNCAYLQGQNTSIPTCGYIFIVDRKRPCPPGKGCTVKVLRRKRKGKQNA